MFEKLKGVEHITKVVTLIVKGEEYDCFGNNVNPLFEGELL